MKKMLWLAIAAFVLPPQCPVCAAASAVGWWKLDEGTGSTAADSSSGSNNGTLSGSPTWVAGVLSNGLDFSGSQRVSIPYSSAYNLTNAITLSVWVRPTTVGHGPSSFDQFFTKGDGYFGGWGLRYTDLGRVLFQMTGQNGNSVASWNVLPTNRWSHVVATFDGTTAKLYINGLLGKFTTWTGQMLTNSSGIDIAGISGSAVTFPGKIDDARVFSNALTETEVQQLFFAADRDLDRLPDGEETQYGTDPDNADTDGDGYLDGYEVLAGTDPLNPSSYPNLTIGLVGWWKLNENSGTVAVDSSGSGKNGEIKNGAAHGSGILSNAVQFDGATQWIVADVTALTNSALAVTNVTMSIWAYVTNKVQDSTLLSRTDNSGGYAAYWQNTYDRVLPSLPGIPVFAIGLPDIKSNEWNHFLFTYDGAQVTGYLNGRLYRSDIFTNNMGRAAQPFFLAQSWVSTMRFQGKLDDARVYNNALSSGNAAALALVDTDGDGLPDIQETRLGTNPVRADTDGDGMPDGWEIKYGFNPLYSSDAAQDADGDGFTNLQEYQNGSDPQDSDSHPVFAPTFAPDGGTFITKNDVIVSCLTTGATIHYTIDGQTPTESDSTVTSGAGVQVPWTLTLKAKAWKTGMPPSFVKSTNYVITGAIAAGAAFGLALDTSGQVWSWGVNESGALGNGTGTNYFTPRPISGLTEVVALAMMSGTAHSLVIKSNGTVWTWGLNYWGQLGNGTQTTSYSPAQISNFSDVVALAASYDHSLALKSNRTVWSWGLNAYGQLGNGTTNNSLVPLQVSGLSNVVQVAAGYFHSVALNSNRTVWSWGLNAYGQLGNGTSTNCYTAVQAIGVTNATAVYASGGTTWAICEHVIWAWGSGYSSTPAPVPCDPICLSNITAVSSDGGTTFYALTTDSTVWLQSNHYCQRFGVLTNVIAIAGSLFALKSDGTVWVSGTMDQGTAGKLGLGDGFSRYFPVQNKSLTLTQRPPDSSSPITTVGDGIPDPQDPFPGGSAPGDPPEWNDDDVTPPVISLQEPTNAVLLP